MLNKRNWNARDGSRVLKGMFCGLAGGLVASWAMNQFQSLLSNFPRQNGDPQEQQPEQSGADNEPATEKAAVAIAKSIFGHELPQSIKKPAGEVVHYAMGAISGVMYGAAAEFVPDVTIGAGLPFGAAVWLVADEVIVPALQLSKQPLQYLASKHLNALASHLVYGLTTEIGRRSVRQGLRRPGR